MQCRHKSGLIVLIFAAACLLLLSVGRPSRARQAPTPRRSAAIASEAVLKNCVPGTQVSLPSLDGKLSFLCFMDMRTGLLDNLGPVSIPKPILEAGDGVSIAR